MEYTAPKILQVHGTQMITNEYLKRTGHKRTLSPFQGTPPVQHMMTVTKATTRKDSLQICL